MKGGAWGLTVAINRQVRVARASGVHRILLADEIVGWEEMAFMFGELRRIPHLCFNVWSPQQRAFADWHSLPGNTPHCGAWKVVRGSTNYSPPPRGSQGMPISGASISAPVADLTALISSSGVNNPVMSN